MSNRFIISDLHLGHAGVCKFLNDDGTPLRPWDDPEEMNEALIANWNSTVVSSDTVYVLGDVVINRRYLTLLDRLNGRKRLVMGNHDIFGSKDYLKYFIDIHGSLVRTVKGWGNVIMTHIPVHPSSKGRFRANVHGHLHGNKYDDPWYRNVSVEQIDFTPVEWNVLIEELKEKLGD